MSTVKGFLIYSYVFFLVAVVDFRTSFRDDKEKVLFTKLPSKLFHYTLKFVIYMIYRIMYTYIGSNEAASGILDSELVLTAIFLCQTPRDQFYMSTILRYDAYA